MKNYFYVYAHKRASDDSIFYIGKGSHRRAWLFFGRSQQWQRTKNKHGIVVEILASNLSEINALETEMEFIALIGRENLCNHTDGGEGMSGYSPSQDTRLKMSKNSSGRKHTPEAKAKMSASHAGVKKTAEHIKKQAASLIGRKFSKEHKAALSAAIKAVVVDPEWGKKSGAARQKRIFCITNSTFYLGARDAAIALGLDRGAISMVASGKYKHTGGFVFNYDKNS